MKFCINCKHYNSDQFCDTSKGQMNNVLGVSYTMMLGAGACRMNETLCGDGGKWFEPKTVDPGEGWRLLCNEIVRGGDEVFMGGKWVKTMASGSKTSDPECADYLYRRRVEPAIDRCPEGHQTILEHSVCGFYYVQCNNPNCAWRGNRSENQAGAAEKWNAVMRAFQEAKK